LDHSFLISAEGNTAGTRVIKFWSEEGADKFHTGTTTTDQSTTKESILNS